MDLVGDWDVTIKTPVGSLQIVYSFADRDGVLTGSAAGRHETVEVTDIVVADDGRQVSWRQTVTRPMCLNLAFEVLVDGDRFTGHSRAGRLPRSAVSGVRRR